MTEANTTAEVVAEEEETAVAMEAVVAEAAAEGAAPDSHQEPKFLPWQQGHK